MTGNNEQTTTDGYPLVLKIKITMRRFNQKNQINRFVNAQRVLQVILEEQLLVDGFRGKKSKEAAGYQKAIDFLKGLELEI